MAADGSMPAERAEQVETFNIADIVRFRRQNLDKNQVEVLLASLERGELGTGTYRIVHIGDTASKSSGHSQSLRLFHIGTDTPLRSPSGRWSGWWFEKVPK